MKSSTKNKGMQGLLLIVLLLFLYTALAIQPSGGSGATLNPSAPSSSQQPLSCSNSQHCREIDEVWQRIGTLVRGSSEVWDVSTTTFGWRAFTVVYLSPTQTAPFGTTSTSGVLPAGYCFPVERNSFVSNRDNFGDDRDSGQRCHAGIDLLTHNEARVVAVDNGEIVGLQPSFIDPNEGCGATGAAALLVYHQNLLGVGEVTINYGELLPSDVTSFTVGQEVVKGQFLGQASPCGMLHFEMYEGKVTHTISWDHPTRLVVDRNQCALNPVYLATKPPKIKDPTGFIKSIENNFCGQGTAGVSLSSASPAISGAAIPYGAKTECDIRLLGEFVPNNPSPANLQHWQEALQKSGANGKTWIGKMNGNGLNDNVVRPDSDVGRDTIIFIPCRTDLSKPVELAYYFHGNTGFQGGTSGDMMEVASQLKTMSESGRNVILVYPEMIYSLNNERLGHSRGATLWDGSDADLALLDSSVRTTLSGLGLTGPIAYISVTGHSRGGAAIGWAARNPNLSNNYLKQLGVNRIIFSDAGYAEWHYSAPYDTYVKLNSGVEMDLLVEDPSLQGMAHDPTFFGINFLHKIGGGATQGWNVQQAQSCTGNSRCVGSYATPGATKDVPFNLPGTNIWYYPISKGHDGISEMSFVWFSPSTSQTQT